jgi:hypothetical protein
MLVQESLGIIPDVGDGRAVPGVAAKNALEMPCIHDEEMIEGLGSDGLVEARHVLRVTS